MKKLFYSLRLRREALRKVQEGERLALVARALEVPMQTLLRWVKADQQRGRWSLPLAANDGLGDKAADGSDEFVDSDFFPSTLIE